MTLAIALAALLGAAIALARQATYGALLNLDSLNYLSTARNLLEGQIFIDHTGGAYGIWPPLYPLALAVASLGIADPLTTAGPLNVAIFALTIFLVGRYLRRRLSSGYMVAWACFALALSVPIIDSTASALTEPLFILLATLALTRADDYLTEGKRSALLWAVALGALAMQTRYIGIAVPAAICLALLLQAGASLPRRFGRVAFVSLAAVLPPAAWMARNYLLTGSFTQHQPPVDYSLLEIASDALGALWIWARYDNADWVRVEWLSFLPAASAALLIAMLAAIAIGCVLARALGSSRTAEARRTQLLFGGFALAYAAIFFALLATGRPYHGVFFRYLTPLYLPLVVVVAVAADGLLAFLREGGLRDGAIARRWRAARRLAGAGLLAALTLWLVGQTVPNARAIVWANSDEFQYGYTTRPWTNSPTLRRIDEYPMDGIVYSNRPSVAYFRNDGEALHIPLNLYRYEGGYVARLADWLVEAQDGAWLVWFKRRADGIYLPDAYLPQMRVMTRLRPVAEFADGAIFRVNRDYRPDAGDNPFIAAYEGIASGDLKASAYSDFSVYWDDDRVVYLREPCGTRDIDARFMLHIFPADPADLPTARTAHGFVNADFNFAAHGALFDGKCVGIAPLPDYAIERIRTGQYIIGGGPQLWSVDARPERPEAHIDLSKYADISHAYLDAYRAAVAGEYGEPVARADFDVYRAGDALVYIREPCRSADVEARFFLHIFPDAPADLPVARLEIGFENLDFQFAYIGADLDGRCVAIAPLPDYAIERIRTGQYIIGGGPRLWSVDVYPNSLSMYADTYHAYLDAYRAAVAGEYGAPAARADFDVYRAGDALVYIKEPCRLSDAGVRFLLHIFPDDPADLPTEWVESGFENLDFRFADGGADLGGRCVAIARLPGYAIERIRTGQFAVGGGVAWRVEFAWE